MNDASLWRAAEALFHEMLDLSPAERTAHLAGSTAPPAARQEAARLLALHDEAGDFLQTALPHAIGPYRPVAKLGQGGMGIVYLAFCVDPPLERPVALKLLGIANAERLSLREARILSRLDHPNIARLLDSGRTAERQLYLATEYVAGEDLLTYCDHLRLPLRSRLELFLSICSAVSYAHQNLVIHCDLKPANILVGEDGRPRLLDFGLGRLLSTPSEGAAEDTALLDGLLTPQYASPEQIRGETLTTASDLYSLGLILFALLTGETARPAVGTAASQWRPLASLDLPQLAGLAPSTVTAALRSTAPERLRREWSGDLEAIVAKTTRAHPEDRYASVEALAADLKRHLHALPIEARPPDWRYRAGRFCLRHVRWLSATAAVLILLAGGLASALWQAHVARQRQQVAEREAAELQRLSGTLLRQLNQAIATLPGATEARRLMINQAMQGLQTLEQEAGSDSQIQRELANGYLELAELQGQPYHANLGETDAALATARHAQQIFAALPRPRRQDRQGQLHAAVLAGELLTRQGHFAAAIPILQRALRHARALASRPPSLPSELMLHRCQIALADALLYSNRHSQAAAYYRDALRLSTALAQHDPANLSVLRARSESLQRVAAVELDAGLDLHGLVLPGRAAAATIARSVADYRRSEAVARLLLEAQPGNADYQRWDASVNGDLAEALWRQGRLAAAAVNAGDDVDVSRLLAQADPHNLESAFDLEVAYGVAARVAASAGHLTAARTGYHQAEAVGRRILAADPSDHENLGRLQAMYQEEAQLPGTPPSTATELLREAAALQPARPAAASPFPHSR